MPRLCSKTGRLMGMVAGCCLLLICLIWHQLYYQLNTDRNATLTAAIQRNSNRAVTLEQYTIRTIRNANAVLKSVKMEYEEKGKNIDFTAILDKEIFDQKYFNGVSVIDSNGRQQVSNLNSPDCQINFSDSGYFSFHKTHRGELYISKPLLSPSIGKLVIVLSRRIEKPDGSFNGVVTVQIEPYMFTVYYSKANMGTNDIMSLISPDGITYARRTGNNESSGEDISISPLFSHVAKTPIGHYYAKDAIRGIPSFFSYRKSDKYPVIATVGTAEADILKDYYARAKWNYIFAISCTLLLVVFAGWICNVLIHRRKTYRKTKDRETRYRAIFENSNDAVIVVMADGSIETMNNAAHSLFKVTANNHRKMLFNELFKSAQPGIRLSVDEVRNTNVWKEEVVFTCTDDSSFTGETVYSTYQDAGGNDRFIVLVRDISQRKKMQQRLLAEQKRYQQKLTKQIIRAQEREREKIGHELHDNINQILTTVKLYLEMAINTPDMRECLLPKSLHHVMNCITEIRTLSHELSVPFVGPQSLIDSLKALVETVECSSKLRVSFIYDNYHTCLIMDQKLAIYRILQEQFNNILKHAEATEVFITLSQTEITTELSICDNGKGFDLNAKRSGIGLNNILSRVKVFGGQMAIDSKEEQGCLLHITLPIIAEDDVEINPRLNQLDEMYCA